MTGERKAQHVPSVTEQHHEATGVAQERSRQATYTRFSPRALGWIPLYIIVTLLYAIAVLGSMIWMLFGPGMPGALRVLRTGTLKVDQFYSGLALSGLLTPAAVVIRSMARDIGLLHPFALAYKKGVRVHDMDRIMQPDARSILSLRRYSSWKASVQAILLAVGMLLVPIGTLMVTTATYHPQTPGTAVVGMPTLEGNGVSLNSFLSDFPYEEAAIPDFVRYDFFAWNAANLAMSTFVVEAGNVTSTSQDLGPAVTGNITFETGVIYHGLVTYQWASNCEDATNDISYTIDTNQTDASSSYAFLEWQGPGGPYSTRSYFGSPTVGFIYNTTNLAGLGYDTSTGNLTLAPYGGTLFLSSAAYTNMTAHMPAESDRIGLTIDDNNGIWVSRVKCTPSFSWRVSSCTWNGNEMEACTATPGENVTALSTDGLNKLTNYMVTTAYSAYNEYNHAYGTEVMSLPFVYWPDATGPNQWQAPGKTHYDNFWGAVARSIATASTVGYYGTVTVSTTGETPRDVYVARTYIVGIVLAMLVVTVAVAILDIIGLWIRRIPLQRASFLTIVAATRNTWWTDWLRGGSAAVQARSKKSELADQRIMFGEESDHVPERVGLVPKVRPIQRGKIYDG